MTGAQIAGEAATLVVLAVAAVALLMAYVAKRFG